MRVEPLGANPPKAWDDKEAPPPVDVETLGGSSPGGSQGCCGCSCCERSPLLAALGLQGPDTATPKALRPVTPERQRAAVASSSPPGLTGLSEGFFAWAYWKPAAACGSCCCLLVVGLTVFLAIFLTRTQNPCSVKSFEAKYVLPSEAAAAGLGLTVELATSANINTSIPLDFVGIWWIRWTDPSIPIQVYSSLHLEEGLSFVGMRSNTTGPPWFPAEVKIPSGLNHRWMFSDSVVGRTAMIFASQKDPAGELTVRFSDDSNALLEIGPCNWMRKLDQDRWLRESVISGCVNDQAGANAVTISYELTRIVNGDGSPHPVYWPLWLQHMEGTEVRVFVEDNQCKRECGVQTSDCQSCEDQCR